MRIFDQQVANAESDGVGDQQFGNLLRSARIIDGQPRPQPEAHQRPDQEHHHAHHHVFGNRKVGVRGLNMQGVKQRDGRAAKVMIHKFG